MKRDQLHYTSTLDLKLFNTLWLGFTVLVVVFNWLFHPGTDPLEENNVPASCVQTPQQKLRNRFR